MGARLADSEQYAHLWGTAELRAIFDERARLQAWLDIVAAAARAQAKVGIIPSASAEQITRAARVERLDLEAVAEQTRQTSHSTLGLIRELQRVLPEPAGDHVYFGMTVQDVTDTWTGLAMARVGSVVWRDLRTIEGLLLDLAERHRDAVMVGRTHGQPGAPITFGFKAASWADEVRRALEHMTEGRRRWIVAQLGGAVGVLGFYGDDGLALRAAFCAELGLGEPAISWLTARDRIAEFAHVLAMVTATLARIGNEVYELQRPEIGELREATTAAVVGSITMPHKRNPERSEHLDTLARLARANSSVLLEGMVAPHERDGRAWKAEWVAFPEVCLLTGAALAMGVELLRGLEVDTDAMAARVEAERSGAGSERVLAVLSARLGREAAQGLLHEAIQPGSSHGRHDIEAALAGLGLFDPAELDDLLHVPAIDGARAMVDEVVARGRLARRSEPEEWL